MTSKIIISDRTLAEQVASIRQKYPHFKCKFISHNKIKVSGAIRPTSRSLKYEFSLFYTSSTEPKVLLVSPLLQRNIRGELPPHLYNDNSLCLYRPKYYEFKRKDYLSDTIIPWISLWLYYYELWLVTEKWLGGGEHPEI
jgi:hypothetical protein